MKKMITAAALLVGMLGLVPSARAVDLEDVSTGAVKPGEWNGSFTASRQYAEANQLPLFVFWSNPGCAKCNKMKTALNGDTFKNWRAAQNIVFCFNEGDGTVKLWAKNSSGHFPYMRFYWSAGSVDARFSGRMGEIGASGATLEAQLINRLTSLMGSSAVTPSKPSGGNDKPSTDNTPVIGDEWKRARVLHGAYRDENGNFMGLITVKCGKVNARTGIAKVSSQVTGLDGKRKSLRTLNLKVNRETVYSANGTVGGVQVAISGSKISGTFTPANGRGMEIVSQVSAGGSIADGKLAFTMSDEIETIAGQEVFQEYLPYFVTFNTVRSRWSFGAKGMLRYDRNRNEFVMSNEANASGLKMTYKASTGQIKGSCKVYAKRNSSQFRTYTATIYGLWINGSGSCLMQVRGAGSVLCRIDPAN